MGDAGLGSSPLHDALPQHLDLDLDLLARPAVFPSPASPSACDPLDTPSLFRHVSISTAPPFSASAFLPHATELEFQHAVPTEPGPMVQPQILTPPAKEDYDQPCLNMIVGGALAPVPTSPRPRSASKSKPGLQLPSFETLGIAAPHPDRFGLFDLDKSGGDARGEITPDSLHVVEDAAELSDALEASLKLGSPALPARSNIPAERLASRPVQSPTSHYGGPLTPPADLPYIDWNDSAFMTLAMLSADEQPQDGVREEEAQVPAPSSQSVGHGLLHLPERDPSLAWSDGAVQDLVHGLRAAPGPNNSLRILSHALPSPSLTGHIFTSVISAVQEETAAVESWINVFHAIPGRFNLADLPRSPPTTPGPAIGGSDYFTEKVFDSAVSIADYQDDLSHLPRSPRSVVPPGSVDISIVERYIPPTSSNEYRQMFDMTGQSILVDRLKELSPNNGSLLFIYPTKAGGVTFMKEYLSPVLDPVLRSMGVVHGLSTSLSTTLGGMPAIDRLPTHESCREQLEGLLARIAQGGPAVERLFEQRQQPHLTLSYAAKQYVVLDRETWAQSWWAKQEKPRIREAVTRYAREAQTRSSNAHVERPRTSTELLQELLKGVEERPYRSGREPQVGIEVSVFVVRRSA